MPLREYSKIGSARVDNPKGAHGLEPRGILSLILFLTLFSIPLFMIQVKLTKKYCKIYIQLWSCYVIYSEPFYYKFHYELAANKN